MTTIPTQDEFADMVEEAQNAAADVPESLDWGTSWRAAENRKTEKAQALLDAGGSMLDRIAELEAQVERQQIDFDRAVSRALDTTAAGRAWLAKRDAMAAHIAKLEAALEDIANQLRGIVQGHPQASTLTPAGMAAVTWQMYTGMSMGRKQDAARIAELEARIVELKKGIEWALDWLPRENGMLWVDAEDRQVAREYYAQHVRDLRKLVGDDPA